MSKEIMNTKEVAQYLGIHEKQVYALVGSSRIPATRVTGKWIFPKKLIDQWIEEDAKHGMEEAMPRSRRISGSLLAAGSNDPLLDILLTFMRNSYPQFFIFTANTGSTEGLKSLNMGYTDIAWSHLLDAESGEYNIPYLPDSVNKVKYTVVNLFRRETGFIIAKGNPAGFQGFEDLVNGKIKMVNRQKGSGTRILMDHHLNLMGIDSKNISGYDREVYTHFDVGLSILSGDADTGIATAASAKLLGLDFIPLTWESFDMVLDQSTFFKKELQIFIEVLTSEEFHKNIHKLEGYDFKESGKIIYSAA